MLRRFLKVAIATSNLMKEIYNGRFAPEFSASIIITNTLFKFGFDLVK